MTIHKVRIELVFKNDDDYFKFLDDVGCLDEFGVLHIPVDIIRGIGREEF